MFKKYSYINYHLTAKLLNMQRNWTELFIPSHHSQKYNTV